MKKETPKSISPNNWLTKIGMYIDENDRLVLPFKKIIVSIGIASKAYEGWIKDISYEEKLQLSQVISIDVRCADTFYFRFWSENILNKFKSSQNNKEIFQNCFGCIEETFAPNYLRATVYPKLSELRKKVNEAIIHKMENSMLIVEKEMDYAKEYYDLFLTLNFFGFPEIKSLKKKKCKNHR